MKGITVCMMLIGGIIMNSIDRCHSESNDGGRIRRPVYSGSWYPGTPDELRQTVDRYIATSEIPAFEGRVIGIVTPHAGYVYSGPVAGAAYKAVKNCDPEIVVLMGNAHREGFRGAAVDDAAAYASPLGTVTIDTDLAELLTTNAKSVRLDGRPHQREHSLEIQLPFLQRSLKPGFKILPILFGMDAEEAEREILQILPPLLNGKPFLLVSSTDLTHYPEYSDAKRIDKRTAEIIASMEAGELISHEQTEMAKGTPNLACVLCGSTATSSVMQLCRRMGADRGQILKVANSGDVTAGDHSQVVGYGAIAFIDTGEPRDSVKDNMSKSEPISSLPETLSDDEQKMLLDYSRKVLNDYVLTGEALKITSGSRLNTLRRGVFVSLHTGQDLRGCIGYIEPVTNCMDAVYENTISACSRDPRFPEVSASELDKITIEISVLTPPLPIASWKEIVIGRHGVILEKQRRKAVFLPQVAPEQGWDIETMLMYLSMKAGLPPNGWTSDARFKVFEAQVFSESGH